MTIMRFPVHELSGRCMSPKIISQAKLENGARLVSRRSALIMDESDGKIFTKMNGINDVHNVILNMYTSTENNPLVALCLLPYLLPECRSKPDLDKIIRFSHVSS